MNRWVGLRWWSGPALLIAWRRLTVGHHPLPLTVRHLLALGGLHQADIGVAQHGGHAARRRVLRPPIGPSQAPAAAGVARSLRRRPPGPNFDFGLWLVWASSPSRHSVRAWPYLVMDRVAAQFYAIANLNKTYLIIICSYVWKLQWLGIKSARIAGKW